MTESDDSGHSSLARFGTPVVDLPRRMREPMPSFIRALYAICILVALANLGRAADRPNIVLIIADDLRYDLLGCNGHPHAQTDSSIEPSSPGGNQLYELS